MSKEEILDKLIKIVKKVSSDETIDYKKINLETKLIEDLKFTSLNLLLTGLEIEKEFDIVLSNLNLDLINKVDNIVSYIQKEVK